MTMGNNSETHPAWACISIGRRTGGRGVLFDSPIRHQGYVAITISRAERRREVERSWVFDREQLIEVVLSEEQFARVITSLNCASTPCTISRLHGELVEDPPDEDLMGSVSAGVQASIASVGERADDALSYLQELHASGKATRAQLAEAVAKVRHMRQGIVSDLPFLARCMNEAFDKVQTASRVEILGFIERQAARAGLLPEAVLAATVLKLGAGAPEDL